MAVGGVFVRTEIGSAGSEGRVIDPAMPETKTIYVRESRPVVAQQSPEWPLLALVFMLGILVGAFVLNLFAAVVR